METNTENNNSNNKLTFELKDLSYEELIETYNAISEFIKYLQNLKIADNTENSNEGGDQS